MDKTQNNSWAILIPAFNEQDSIARTIAQVKSVLPRIPASKVELVVIDDGSTDATSRILAGIDGITVLTHQRNFGYGAALRTGIDFGRADWIAIVDADGTYPIPLLPELIRDANTGQFDMVIGNRRGPGISSAPFRRLARLILRKIVHTLTQVHVPDLNSGMRVFRRSLYTQFEHLLPSGFSFTSTITVASLYCGFRLKYVDIPYAKRQGRSHIRPHRDFINFVILIVRLASYFEPLRFFFPLAFALALVSLGKGVRDFLLLGYIGSMAVMVGLTALNVFLTGILADVIVRRFAGATVPRVRVSMILKPTVQRTLAFNEPINRLSTKHHGADTSQPTRSDHRI